MVGRNINGSNRNGVFSRCKQRAIWLEHLARARPLIKLDRLLSVLCRLLPIHQSTWTKIE